MASLFEPLQAGAFKLRNRIVLAPLTRCRSSAGRVPNDLMREYYVQRASAGLMISEATSVSAMGVGYPDTPGIWSEEQVAGWKRITEAVHAAGGTILLQLWHVGRVSHPDYLGGALPVAPSAIAPTGHVSLMRPLRDYVVPRPSTSMRFPALSRNIAVAPRTPNAPALTASKYMAPTAIYSTNFCRTAPTSAPTRTAGRSRIVPA